MGLSKAQKIRKHGERAGRAQVAGESEPRASRPSRPAPGQAPDLPQRRQEPRRDASRSTPGLLVGVVISIGVLLTAYVNLLILPAFAQDAADGMGAPELRVTGFDQAWMTRFSQALGEQGTAQYASIHWSTGLLAPLVLCAGMALMVVLGTRRRWKRAVRLSVVAAHLVVSVLMQLALEQAVGSPDQAGPVTWAAVLVVLRWVLGAGLLAVALWMLVDRLRQAADELAAQAPSRT